MTLCKCNNIYIDDEWASPYHIKDDTLTLGKYSTKERALEVLDEIQNHLLKMGNDEILTDKNGIINEIKHYGIVYEMPIN